MKRNLLVSLLCIVILLVPTLVNASGITSGSITTSQQEKLKSSSPDDSIELNAGNVRMVKFVDPTTNLTYLTFSEVGGFTSDTYNSILAVLKVILSDEYYNYFVSKYPALSKETVSFTGFRVKRNIPENERTSYLNYPSEDSEFDPDTDILRVEICSNEFSEVPPIPTPTPTPAVTSTPSPTPTPSTEVTNPSTGDTNIVVLGVAITVAVIGAYFSIRKICED